MRRETAWRAEPAKRQRGDGDGEQQRGAVAQRQNETRRESRQRSTR